MKVQLKWNGDEPTNIRPERHAPKVEVSQGETIDCDIEIARDLARRYKQVELIGVPQEPEEFLVKIEELEEENKELKEKIKELEKDAPKKEKKEEKQPKKDAPKKEEK